MGRTRGGERGVPSLAGVCPLGRAVIFRCLKAVPSALMRDQGTGRGMRNWGTARPSEIKSDEASHGCTGVLYTSYLIAAGGSPISFLWAA